MCAADEVALVDTMNGAGLGTLAAAGALVIVDNRQVADNLDRIVRADLLALATADTAVLTDLTHCRTLIVTGALYDYANGILNKMDDAVRTLACTHTATDTLGGVDLGNAVLDRNGVLGTDSHAIAVAEAGVGAEFVARIAEVCNATALHSVVYISALGSLTVTVAGNVGDLLYNVLSLNAKNACDIPGALVSTGNTEVDGLGLALGKSLSIRVTSRVAASAAVGAGEGVTDSEEFLVLLDAEELIGNGKNYSTNDSYCG